MNLAGFLAQRAAAAVRGTKYRTQGVVNGQRRDLPPTTADRRYAVAACSSILRELAEIARAAGPLPAPLLDKLAHTVESQEPPR
jgi:hypothetical protein